MSCKPMVKSKVISCIQVAIGGAMSFAAINVYNGNEKFYSSILMPTIHAFVNAETAHRIAIKCAKYNFLPKCNENTDSSLLRTTVWGLHFANPIGLAAGFDKNGEAVNGLSKLGFGFIEVGSVTPKPQPGNEKPRVFRLNEDKAIINRYGFNSDGHDVVNENLKKQFNAKKVIIGLNLGKNKESSDASKDYVDGLIKFNDNPAVDYFVINISSPNTPGLRGLQEESELEKLLDNVLKTKAANNFQKPLLIKISPDLTFTQKSAIAKVLLNRKNSGSKVDGIIVSNTTISRSEDLKADKKVVGETGGLSGQPLKKLSTETIKDMYKLTKGSIPIIGVGGVSSGEDAFEKITAGASLIQIYSVLAFEGPPIINKIKRELTEILRENGFKNVMEAVGKNQLK